MKKMYSLAALALMGAAMSLTSCSSDNVPEANDQSAVAQEDQVISLAMAGASEGLTTRAGNASNRKLYSSEAKMSINKVKLIIVPYTSATAPATASVLNGQTISATVELDDWMNTSVKQNGQDDIRYQTVALTGDKKLKDGNYLIYAVATNDNCWTDFDTFWGKNKDDAADLPLDLTKTGNDVEEIFAGMKAITVANNKVQASVTLMRQVAGALGYVTKIPVYGTGQYSGTVGQTLRLVAKGSNTNLLLDQFNDQFSTTESQTATKAYVVNGYTPDATATAYKFASADQVLWTMTISDWFTAGDSDNNGTLGAGDTWTNHIGDANAKVANGSMLAGNFVIPFAMEDDTKSTLELQMLNGSTVIRTWTVKLEAQQDASTLLGKFSAFAATAHTAHASTALNAFDVVRNHLYTIGIRKAGDTPDNPGDDDDTPEDLDKESVKVYVDANWEEIHHMTLD